MEANHSPKPTESRREPIKAIPTRYKGINFRSRLEARWARMFDLMEWEWDYEPIDLEGYIPDFIIKFPYAPIIAEIKPAVTIADLAPLTDKIDRSGWDKEVLLLGASIRLTSDDFFPCPGLLRETNVGTGYGCGWDNCWMHFCIKCKKYSIHHTVGSFHCRQNGCHDGDHYLGDPPGSFDELWAIAGNAVQWKPGASQ